MPPPSFAAREQERLEQLRKAMQSIQDDADEMEETRATDSGSNHSSSSHKTATPNTSSLARNPTATTTATAGNSTTGNPSGNLHATKMFAPSPRSKACSPPASHLLNSPALPPPPPPPPNAAPAGSAGPAPTPPAASQSPPTNSATGSNTPAPQPDFLVLAATDSDDGSTADGKAPPAIAARRGEASGNGGDDDGSFCEDCDPTSLFGDLMYMLYAASLRDPYANGVVTAFDATIGKHIVVLESRGERHRKVFAVGCGMCSLPLLVLVVIFAVSFVGVDSDPKNHSDATYLTLGLHAARVFVMMIVALYVFVSQQASTTFTTLACLALLITSSLLVFIPGAGSVAPVLALLAAVQLFRMSHRFIFFVLCFTVAVLCVVTDTMGADNSPLVLARFNTTSSITKATTSDSVQQQFVETSIHWSLALLRSGTDLVFLLWLAHGVYCYVDLGGSGGGGAYGRNSGHHRDGNDDDSGAEVPNLHSGSHEGRARNSSRSNGKRSLRGETNSLIMASSIATSGDNAHHHGHSHSSHDVMWAKVGKTASDLSRDTNNNSLSVMPMNASHNNSSGFPKKSPLVQQLPVDGLADSASMNRSMTRRTNSPGGSTPEFRTPEAGPSLIHFKADSFNTAAGGSSATAWPGGALGGGGVPGQGAAAMPLLSEQRRVCIGIFHIMEVLTSVRGGGGGAGTPSASSPATSASAGGNGLASGIGSPAGPTLGRALGGIGGIGAYSSISTVSVPLGGRGGNYTPGQSSLQRSVAEARLRRDSIGVGGLGANGLHRSNSMAMHALEATAAHQMQSQPPSEAASSTNSNNNHNNSTTSYGAPAASEATTAAAAAGSGNSSSPPPPPLLLPRRATYISAMNTSTEGCAAFLDEIMRIISDTDGYVHSIVGGQIVVSWNSMTNLGGRQSQPPDHCAAECVRLLRQHRHENRARRQLVCCGAVHAGQATCIRLRGTTWAKPGVPVGIVSAANGSMSAAAAVTTSSGAGTPSHLFMVPQHHGGSNTNNNNNHSAFIPIDSILAPWLIIVQRMSQRAATLGISVVSPAIYHKVRMNFCLFPVDSFAPNSSSSSAGGAGGGLTDMATTAMVLSEVDLTMTTKEKFLARGVRNRGMSLQGAAVAAAGGNHLMTPNSFSLKRGESASNAKSSAFIFNGSNNNNSNGSAMNSTLSASGNNNTQSPPGNNNINNNSSNAQDSVAASAAFNEIMKPMTLYTVIGVRDDDNSKYVVDLLRPEASFLGNTVDLATMMRRSSMVQNKLSSITSHPGGNWSTSSFPTGTGRVTPVLSDNSSDPTTSNSAAARENSTSFTDQQQQQQDGSVPRKSLTGEHGTQMDGSCLVHATSGTMPPIPSPTNAAGCGTVSSGGFRSPGFGSPTPAAITTVGRACDCAQEMVQSAYDGQFDRMSGFYDAVKDAASGVVPDEERELLAAMHEFVMTLVKG